MRASGPTFLQENQRGKTIQGMFPADPPDNDLCTSQKAYVCLPVPLNHPSLRITPLSIPRTRLGYGETRHRANLWYEGGIRIALPAKLHALCKTPNMTHGR